MRLLARTAMMDIAASTFSDVKRYAASVLVLIATNLPPHKDKNEITKEFNLDHNF